MRIKPSLTGFVLGSVMTALTTISVAMTASCRSSGNEICDETSRCPPIQEHSEVDGGSQRLVTKLHFPPPVEELSLRSSDIIPIAKKSQIVRAVEEAIAHHYKFSETTRLPEGTTGPNVAAAFRYRIDHERVVMLQVLIMGTPEAAARKLRQADLVLNVRSFRVVPGIADEAYAHEQLFLARHKNVFIRISPDLVDMERMARTVLDAIRSAEREAGNVEQQHN